MIRDFLTKLGTSTDTENRKAILNQVDENKSAKVLDVGCGAGELTKEIGKKAGTHELYGIEIAEEYAQLAEKNGIKVYRADLNKEFPIESETFDIVCANQVIEHLHETDLFIKKIHRILQWGGVAIISTPNLAAVYNIIFLILGFQLPTAFVSDETFVGNPFNPKYGTKRKNIHPGHLRIFTYRSLKELFEFHGFKVEKIEGVGYYPFPTLIAKFFSSISPKHSVYLTMKVRKERSRRMIQDDTNH